jgi:hypothetical protein
MMTTMRHVTNLIPWLILAAILAGLWMATPLNVRVDNMMDAIRCDENRAGLRFGQRDHWGCDD